MAKQRLLATIPGNSRDKLIVLASLFATFFIFCSVFAAKYHNPWRSIRVLTDNAVHPFKVEVANTDFERRRGLMFRKSLEESKGMLFVYDEPSLQSFWMKNTLIPLDILFIGSDLRIKSISENTPPCPSGASCPSYSSTEPVQYVLELNGGVTRQKTIGVGDRLLLFNAIDDSDDEK